MINKKDSLDFNRIEYLLNPKQFENTHVTIVGLGSGGAPVCDHLTMNGIRRWSLFDPDILESVNLIKHPRLRREIGEYKVNIQKQWILDRNPNSNVNAYKEDVMLSKNFVDSLHHTDLVLSCPDKKSVREFVNDKCVEAKVPCITASVFRTGIGGEVFGYIPSETGCYRCLQIFSLLNNLNITDDALGLTQQEKERIYGLNEVDFVASGLSIDIQMIALVQVRMALSILLRKKNKIPMVQLKSNWIIFGNRPAKGIFKRHFEIKQMILRPQKDCGCNSSKYQE